MQQPHHYCELCNKSASIYCPSDSAFLCETCDTKVHTANFLVARHFRLPLHTKPTTHDIIASSSSSSSSTTEESTTHPNSTDLSSSSSSDHTRNPQPLLTHTTKTRIDIKLRNRMAIQIANWSTKLHHHHHQLLNQKSIIPISIKLLELCLTRLPYIPVRVAAAASFWVAIRITHHRYNNNSQTTISNTSGAVSEIRRVEQVTDVPGKLILAVEGKLLRLLKRRKRCRRGLAGSMTMSPVAVEFQEGWAEC